MTGCKSTTGAAPAGVVVVAVLAAMSEGIVKGSTTVVSVVGFVSTVSFLSSFDIAIIAAVAAGATILGLGFGECWGGTLVNGFGDKRCCC